MTNVATLPTTISKGMAVATVYSANNFDVPRIQSHLESLPQASQDDRDPKEEHLRTDGADQTQQDNLEGANFGQLSPSEKEVLIGTLRDNADLFAVNRKAVAACKGPPMIL